MNRGEILVDLLNQQLEIGRSFERGESNFSRGIKAFFERDTLFKLLDGWKCLSKQGMGSGQKIKNRAAIGSFSKEVHGDCNLRTDLRIVPGLCGRPARLLLLLRRQRKGNPSEEQHKQAGNSQTMRAIGRRRHE